MAHTSQVLVFTTEDPGHDRAKKRKKRLCLCPTCNNTAGGFACPLLPSLRRGSLAARLRGRKTAQAVLRFHCAGVCRAKRKANRCRPSRDEAAGVSSHFCRDGAGGSAGNWPHSPPTLVLPLKEETACSRGKWNRIQGLIIEYSQQPRQKGKVALLSENQEHHNLGEERDSQQASYRNEWEVGRAENPRAAIVKMLNKQLQILLKQIK